MALAELLTVLATTKATKATVSIDLPRSTTERPLFIKSALETLGAVAILS
ncbi:hypothetical protein QLH52_10910 [Methylomonas sp. OY6]|uniref:Uncharacterized protein n=1 Tax=Methylomonas defluvii TaxID=3045149 RepID=A0ABU4UEC2_9GAMM|nr:hypothetical protein [Methylomonas sp. OY6]MDX8127792.1 hypothetical protein [Methylomonas sp. OY6]